MTPRIEEIAERLLVGIHQPMSMAENTTPELWRKFMPRRNEISYRSSTDYISMQVYSHQNNDLFSPTTVFEKWAAVEVERCVDVPEGMACYGLPGGMYAVFVHEGPAHEAPRTWQFIFGVWLPGSAYALDDREHFEVLPEGYNPMDPKAREEVWIPVKEKAEGT